MGCSPWSCYNSDTAEWLHFHFLLSCIGEGNGNPLQCSCLEDPRDRGAWWAVVYGVAQSRTRLKWLSISNRHSAFSCIFFLPSIPLLLPFLFSLFHLSYFLSPPPLFPLRILLYLLSFPPKRLFMYLSVESTTFVLRTQRPTRQVLKKPTLQQYINNFKINDLALIINTIKKQMLQWKNIRGVLTCWWGGVIFVEWMT